MNQGYFVTFEGIDGCGKTTQLARAHEYINAKGLPLRVTREPGGALISEKIRAILLSPDNDEMNDRCEILLYLAARAQHVAQKILPALEENQIVLCDRFQDATLAYQGYGRGYDISLLVELNQFATSGLTPNLTFIFDLEAKAAYERLRAMNKAPDRLERNSRDFYQRTREGYLALAAKYPERITVINAKRSIDEVWESVRLTLDALLGVRQN
jgi:dTMP kinase